MTEAFPIHSLGGQPATRELAAVFEQACALPKAAISSLWELLDRAVMDPIPDDLAERTAALCKLCDLKHDDVATPIQAITFLLNSAAGMNTPSERFAEDLTNLCTEGSPLVELLMSGYARTIQSIREGLLRDTLFDHGSVLTGVDWRLDSMLASQRGMQFNMPVTLFTLRYVDGKEGSEKRQTLYLTPQILSELRQSCEYLENLITSGQREAES